MTDPDPVEGEIVDPTVVGELCPHCPHPLSSHYRERPGCCMHSTETETWACRCVDPDDEP